MAANFVRFNQDKKEVVVLARERVTFTKLHEIKPSQSSQLLTLILVLFQTLKTTRIGFYHFKKIARVPPFLSWVSTQVLMHAFISSRLDYCNTLLSGLHKRRTYNLQLLQNSAARVQRRTRGQEHNAAVFKTAALAPCVPQD